MDIKVQRLHYAHGPSLFTWEVIGVPDLSYEDYLTTRAAIQAVEAVLGPMTWRKVFSAEFNGSSYLTAQYRGEPA